MEKGRRGGYAGTSAGGVCPRIKYFCLSRAGRNIAPCVIRVDDMMSRGISNRKHSATRRREHPTETARVGGGGEGGRGSSSSGRDERRANPGEVATATGSQAKVRHEARVVDEVKGAGAEREEDVLTAGGKFNRRGGGGGGEITEAGKLARDKVRNLTAPF